jgi:hypothetical protein
MIQKRCVLSSAWLVACALGLAGQAQAQTWPRYSATPLLPIKGTDGKAQPITPVALNKQGVVVGWTGKPAGSLTTYGYEFNALGFPNVFGPLVKKTSPAFDTYAVQWTNGQPKVLPRVSGYYNTQAWGIADDGTVLVQVADASGRTTESSGAIANGTKSHWRLYQGSTFKIPMMDGKRIVATGALLYPRTFLAPGGELVVNPAIDPFINTKVSVWANGTTSTVPVPATMPTNGRAIVQARLRALWADGQAWLTTFATDTPQYPTSGASDKGCWVGKLGALSLTAESTKFTDVECLAANRNGQALGRAFITEQVQDPFTPTVFTQLKTEGYYTIKGDVWTRVDVNAELVAPAAMDDQGRVLTQMAVDTTATFGASLKLVVIQGGEWRWIDDLLDTPFGPYAYVTVKDVNVQGQVLVSVIRNGGYEYFVLTPR